MKNNIVLIGMPGAGKSTTGVLLAKTLGYDFVDTDLVISRRTGTTLQSLIDAQGIGQFLAEEARAALSLDCEKTVIATGGSMVYSEEAMNHLKSGAVTVFLDVPLDALLRRLRNIRTRGIAIVPGLTLADIYNERLPLYRRYADITVPRPGLPPMEVEDMVSAIIAEL